ncbi:MAG: hypothetical protein JSU94_20725 [Phycisphaerales bacterium]|nr:MAG: hypothetical protein JSU94_20725 [Phycisphaerales bacterium]
MKKFLLLALFALLLPGGCGKSPTYTSYGWAVVTVEAKGEIVAKAVTMTHESMADWVTDPNGARTDPSFSRSGRTWSSRDSTTRANIVETTFRSKAGDDCSIQTIQIRKRPVMVLISAENDEAAIRLHNELITSFAKLGVARKE